MMKNQRNGVDHDECPLKNGSWHDGWTCSVLSDVLGQRPVELFFQDNITTELNPQWTEFVSNLNFSTCSPTFVHWADMLPWMAAGFSTFLGKLWWSLDAIKKIKFKKVTQWNLHYIITPTENKEKKTKQMYCDSSWIIKIQLIIFIEWKRNLINNHKYVKILSLNVYWWVILQNHDH